MVQHSTPILTAEDYTYVHHVAGPLFAFEIPSSSRPRQVYRLRMKENIWSSWSNDSYGIRYTDGTPFEADIKGQTFTFHDRMVLRDSKGAVIGVMLKFSRRMQETIKIYGLRAFREGQAPSDQKYKINDLYLWAEISEHFMSAQHVMTMADGTEYVVDRVDEFPDPQKMRLTCNGIVCAGAQQTKWTPDFEGKSWEITVGPGVDPCLICCFMAAVDEMKESRKDETKENRKD